MASVRKRKNGRYQIRVFCGLNSKAQRIDKSMTWTPPEGMTQKQIEKELERQKVLFEQEVKGGNYYDSNISFEMMSQKWMDEYAKQKLAPKTVTSYEYLLKRINKAIGHKKLRDIQPLHLNSFYNNLKEEGIKHDFRGKPIKGATLAPKTILEHHRLISNILSYAVKWQLIDFNVASRADPPKLEYRETKILDESQIRQMIVLLNDSPIQYRTMIMLLLYTGLRRGELMGLEWKDIDFETRQMQIVRTSQYIGNKTIITKEPKTVSGRRKFTLSKTACNMLMEYRRWQNMNRLKLGSQWIDSDRLFTTWNGQPMYPDTISGWFTDFLAKNGLPKVSLHSLRHYNGTMMIAEGVDIRTVSKRLGHADTSTTLNVYAHALKSRDSEAADRLDEVLAL
ncbi:MAG: tyrosine-type recombinase/integrase [Christensenellales bacterium]|jgi:integrase